MASRSPLLRVHDMLESIRGIEKTLAGKIERNALWPIQHPAIAGATSATKRCATRSRPRCRIVAQVCQQRTSSSVCALTTRGGSRRVSVALNVTFRPQVEADLFALYEYIASQAGAAAAAGYIDRIEKFWMALVTFPNRGAHRDDILPGLRTIGFDGYVATASRVLTTIAFRVLTTSVEIAAVEFERRDGAPEDR